MPTQCPSCRAVNRDTATFCDQCGTRLIGSAAPEPPPASPRQPAGKPLDLPEEEAAPVTSPPRFDAALPEVLVLPKPVAGPPPGPPGRPDTLPEETSAPSPVVMSPAVAPEAQPPYVRPGRPPRYPNVIPWFTIAGALAGFVLFITTESRPGLGPTLIVTAFFAACGLALSVPIQMWLSRAQAKGVVTHMRNWMTASMPTAIRERAVQNWVFDLCLTDDQWRALVDTQGFQLPIVEVAFRGDRVHGAPIEEGSQVVLKGRWRRDRIEVKDLWNLTPVAEVPAFEAPTVFWGRVSRLVPDVAADLRYPGEKQLRVLSFRLVLTDPTFEQLQRDAQGNMLAPWPVEVRAASISGPLNDGDKVEVHGRVVRGTVYSKDVRNHSAGGATLVVKEWAGIPS